MNNVTRPKLPVLVLAGFVGAFLAVIADLSLKGKASAVVKVGEAFRTNLGFNCPNCIAALLLLLIGASLCWIFHPETKGKAFYRGASIITILMTIVPYKVPSAVSTQPGGIAGGETDSRPILERLILDNAWAQQQRDTVPAGETKQPGLKVIVTGKEGRELKELIITIRDFDTGKIRACSKLDRPEFEIYQKKGEYIIVVESPGYRIYREPFRLGYVDSLSDRSRLGEMMTYLIGDTLRVNLDKTWMPLQMQRLLE